MNRHIESPHRRVLGALAAAAAMLSATALAQPAAAPAARAAQQAKEATAATRQAQEAARAQMPDGLQRAGEDARRGLIESIGDAVINGPEGRPIWSMRPYGFLARDDAPDTVHPALWQSARLNAIGGLFKVTDRVYQVRGFDISNMTVIEGDSGLIVIDPLMSTETARAGLALYARHRPARPVVAVIYTHSHLDHFGGVRGVIDEADVRAGRVQVIAPAGFMEEAVSENVIAGDAMARRALYQFGMPLPRNERGQVDAGLGKAAPPGTVTLIAPTKLIERPVETHRIDGIDIVFELTPGAEAPAQMIMHLPALRVLNMAEIASQTLHNLLPMRGAPVRDALAWSRYLDGALQRYGAGSDILIAQHQWPVWGSERLQHFLRVQRDAYKVLHDQTVRWMNHGLPADDIAERFRWPKALQRELSVRPFYGHVKHNIRAIVQRYLGYYDGNPVRLEALPPVEAARRTIAYMGGADAVLARAREDYARGEYRWVAQVASQLVFADARNAQARALAADAYEQLGYQMESATARNSFLQGAAELRQGVPATRGTPARADLVRALPLDLFFDSLAVRLDAAKAEGRRLAVNWRFTDSGQQAVLLLENGALHHRLQSQEPDADATLTLDRATLDDVMLERTTLMDAIRDGRIQAVGQAERVAELMAMLDRFDRRFPIVEPRAD